MITFFASGIQLLIVYPKEIKHEKAVSGNVNEDVIYNSTS